MGHKRLGLLVLFPVALALAACEDPAKDAPKATVSTASTATAAHSDKQAPPAAGGETLPLDGSSVVGFVGSKVTGKHEGTFQKVSGTVTLAGGKIEGGKIVVDVDVSSLKTDAEKLDGHLKSKDFFDVETFPKATFTSTEIKAGGEKGYTITGDLALHGEKKSITFPAAITVGATEVTGSAEFSINRKDFKIVYPGKPDDLIRDDVVLKLALKAPRKK